MNTFLQRTTQFGAVFALGLLGAMQMPTALAGEGQAGHEHTSPNESVSTPAASPQGRPSDGEQMQHGDMGHGSMDHSDMGHDTSRGEHDANKAEAESNHDH
ncbi:MAG: hypothetical protein R3260_13930 [Pseudomonas sp.]|nr:hypothetical protein [Pseudomonas sp.]